MNRRIILTGAVVMLFASLSAAQVTIAITSGSPFFDDFESNASVLAGENCPSVAPVAVNNWVNAMGDDNEWTPDAGGTPSVGTGPFLDQNPGHSLGTYLYTEASGTCTFSLASLHSPTFDISGLTSTQAAFDFWYHLRGAHTGGIDVDLVEQVNSATDGAVSAGSDVFNSVGAAFTANHIGTQINVASFPAAGTYTIIGFIDANNVQLDTTFGSAASGLSFTQTHDIQDVITVSGDHGNLWQQSAEILINLYRMNFGADGNDQLITVVVNGTTGGGFQSDMAIDSFTFRGDVSAFDLQPTAVIAPIFPVANACIPLTNSETVTVEITNNQAPLPIGTMVPLTLDINAGAQTISETFTTAAVVGQGATAQFTFATPVDLSNLGNNTVDLFYTGGDAVPGNDSLNISFDNPSASALTLPFSEDFGTLLDFTGTAAPAGWINPTDENDNNSTSDGWHYDMNGTSSAVGPLVDHTTGTGTTSYAFIEDSVSTTDETEIHLLSPCLDLSGTSNPILSFWAWSFDQNPTAPAPNECMVDIVAPGGVTPGIFNVPDLGVGQWLLQSVGLNAFVGQTIRIRFNGRNDNGALGTPTSTFYHDLSIDDVSVSDVIPGNGQAPQPGLAVLDINAATEVNGFGVPSGLNGPYSTMIASPTPMTIDMGGEANQPIFLLAGTLNLNVVSFPGIGQLDVDNPGLIIVGDGTSGGFINSLFILDAAGDRQLTFPTANLVGLSLAFQGIMFNTIGTVISFSNAVDVSVF